MYVHIETISSNLCRIDALIMSPRKTNFPFNKIYHIEWGTNKCRLWAGKRSIHRMQTHKKECQTIYQLVSSFSATACDTRPCSQLFSALGGNGVVVVERICCHMFDAIQSIFGLCIANTHILSIRCAHRANPQVISIINRVCCVYPPRPDRKSKVPSRGRCW